MKNVLVIGAGRRARGAVLPALRCLADRFRVAAVWTRKARELPPDGGQPITTVDSLDRVDVGAIDLIVAAPTLGQVPSVLAELVARVSRRAVLLLDTPVLPPTGMLAWRYFRHFERVLVSEDTVALPPFLLARRLMQAGAIGRLEHIFFFHNGYKHHALAGLKFLAGGSRIDRIVSRSFEGKQRQKEIRFESGVSATMYEPRDYAIGKFLLRGDRGVIADYDHEPAAGPVARIGYQIEGGVYRGLTLDGEPVPPEGLDGAYLERIGTDLPDPSPMTTMKIRALMDLLVAAHEPRSAFHYDPAEAVSDYLAIKIVDRTGYLPSPHRIGRLASAAAHLPGAPARDRSSA